MSGLKKAIRELFRTSVFGRDAHKCRMCGKAAVDAHHITPREAIRGGGYVLDNGIALCADCHVLAEAHLGDRPGVMERGLDPKYAPAKLYEAVGSSAAKALRASEMADPNFWKN